MRMFEHFAPLSVFAFLLTADLCAQSPEEVVTTSMTKLRAGDVDGYCELFAKSAVNDVAEMIDAMADAAKEDGDSSVLVQFFGDDATPERVKKMSPTGKFKGFIGSAIQMMEDAQFGKFKVIGSVAEGEKLRHVVARMTVKVQELELEAVEVIPLEKEGDSWGILLKADMAAMVQGMRAMFETEED